MADKSITIDVPEERVPEFYAWVAAFLAAEPGTPPPPPFRGGPGGPGRFGPPGHRGHRGPRGAWWGEGERRAWTTEDVDDARWLYGRLSDPARELFDLLIDAPGERFSGNDIALRLGLDKGVQGVVGILAWPGRWCRKLGREFPVTAAARDDGGTDYSMAADVAEVFRGARGGDATA